MNAFLATEGLEPYAAAVRGSPVDVATCNNGKILIGELNTYAAYNRYKHQLIEAFTEFLTGCYTLLIAGYVLSRLDLCHLEIFRTRGYWAVAIPRDAINTSFSGAMFMLLLPSTAVTLGAFS